jgi:WD40 repeat protein
VASCGRDRPDSLERVATLESPGRTGTLRALTLFTSADGAQFLATGGDDCVVNIWDVASRQCVATLEGHAAPVHQLASFRDVNGLPSLASGSGDNLIIIWDVERRSQTARLSGHLDEVTELVVYQSAAGHPCLASGSYRESDQGRIWLWDPQARGAIATFHNDDKCVRALYVFNDARGCDLLVSTGSSSLIRVWDLETRETVFALDGHKGADLLTGFTRVDDVPMCVSSSNGKIKVWDLESRLAVAKMDVSPWVTSLVCVAGEDDRVLLVWSDYRYRVTFDANGLAKLGQGLDDFQIHDLSQGRQVFHGQEKFANAMCAYYDRSSGAPFLRRSAILVPRRSICGHSRIRHLTQPVQVSWQSNAT